MKSEKLRILELALKLMAKAVLRKYRPILVGVTGSIGKSSTKEAIALMLGVKFRVRRNEENYNNEVGIPLTIIGAQSGKSSFFGWANVFREWAKLMLFRSAYPEVLVLELGIDRPGDMKYLLDFLPLSVGVMTNVSSSHLEFFGTIGKIAREKGLVIKGLPESGTAVVSADDVLTLRASSKTKAKVLTFGFGEWASVRAENVSCPNDAKRFDGCRFKIRFDGKMLPVHLPLVVAEHHIPAVLAGMAVGLAFKINPIDMVAAAREYRPLHGRMNMIEGLRRSWIIDDTYNSSPTSLHAALKTLGSFRAARRIVVLGDMLELGDDSESDHEKAAKWVMEYGAEIAVFVGHRMLAAYEALVKSGFEKDRCFWFDTPTAAGESVRNLIAVGDIVLVKGSQGMRMEKVSELLLAKPEKATELLCRQSEDWKRIPFTIR